MEPRWRTRKCFVLHCGHKQNIHKCRNYFKFPRDPKRCKAWVRAAGDKELAKIPISRLSSIRFVCSCHFTSKDFVTPGGIRFFPHAVPNQFNTYVEPLDNNIMQDFGKTQKIVPSMKQPSVEFPNVLKSMAVATTTLDNNNTTNLFPAFSEDFTVLLPLTVSEYDDTSFGKENCSIRKVSTDVEHPKIERAYQNSESLEFIRKHWQHTGDDFQRKKISFNNLLLRRDQLEINNYKNDRNNFNFTIYERKIISY